jgi:hypothetical protein
VEHADRGTENKVAITLKSPELFSGYHRRFGSSMSTTRISPRAQGIVQLINRMTAEEISRVRARLYVYDKAGNELNSDYVELIPELAPLRPGEERTFPVLLRTTESAQRIQLLVDTVENEDAPADYPEDLEVELLWKATKPAGVAPQLALRRAPSGNAYAVVVTNTGRQPIGAMNIDVTCPPARRSQHIRISQRRIGPRRSGVWRSPGDKHLPVAPSERRVVHVATGAWPPKDAGSCYGRVMWVSPAPAAVAR